MKWKKTGGGVEMEGESWGKGPGLGADCWASPREIITKEIDPIFKKFLFG